MAAPDKFYAGLAAAVRRHLGADHDVTEAISLSAGASAATWRARLATPRGGRDIIVQIMEGERQFDGALKRGEQAALQAAVHQQGGLVAEVLFTLDAADGLGDGFAMDLVPGETLAPRILKQDAFAGARAVLARQCGTALAKIHAIDITTLPPLERRSAAQSIGQLDASYRRYGMDIPVFEVALRWLRANLPCERPAVLVHGDYRIGNMIVGPEGLRAVLDWELAHLGDPMEDVGFISVPAWRFGVLDKPIGGFGERQDFYEAYGAPIDHQAIRFWETFSTLKWGVICLFFASQRVSGEVRSVERAVIGRRVAETELDLLMLMGQN